VTLGAQLMGLRVVVKEFEMFAESLFQAEHERCFLYIAKRNLLCTL